MSVGIPVVSAFNGGMGIKLKMKRLFCFFFPCEFEVCAFQIIRILENRELGLKLFVNSRHFVLKRNELKEIHKNQVGIYIEIINEI